MTPSPSPTRRAPSSPTARASRPRSRRQRDQHAYTWQGQEETLVEVYRELLGLPLVLSAEPFSVGRPRPRARTSEGIVLGIGPANSAGQGWAWGRAAERCVPDVTAEVLAVEKPAYNYPADVLVPVPDFARGREWQLGFDAHVSSTWTHALLEAGRPVIGTLHGRDFVGDVDSLRASGIQVGLVFHGSEVRDPRRHAETHLFSPFTDPHEELTAKLQRKCDELLPLVAGFSGPKFVSTPDQLDYVEDAVWLPVVIDTTALTPSALRLPLERDVPVVVHAPSNGILKGTAAVEAVLVPLAERGLIDYRRIEGVPPEHVPALLADADIVVDQLVLGLYGVLSCEGMALGRVVVGHVGDSLRSRVPAEVPIVEATPDDLGEVMARLLDDRDAARRAASAGPAFVAEFHDGRLSAQVLQDHLLSKTW